MSSENQINEKVNIELTPFNALTIYAILETFEESCRSPEIRARYADDADDFSEAINAYKLQVQHKASTRQIDEAYAERSVKKFLRQ